MAKAKKLPSGNWRVLVYSHTDKIIVGGKEVEKRRYKSFTAPTKKEAEFMAAEYKLKANIKKDKGNGGFTLSEAIDNYVALKGNLLSPSTIRGYYTTKPALKMLLDKTLEEISTTDILQKQINENAKPNEKGKRYSSKSLKNQVSFVATMLKANKLSIPDVFIDDIPSEPVAVPTRTEIMQIISILPQAPDIECQILLALTCGLRMSEILALTPSKIVGNDIVIHGAVVRNKDNKAVYKEANKTSKSRRTVHAPDTLINKLNALCESLNPDEYIFTLSGNDTVKRFHKLLRKNRMPEYNVHAMRHAFAAFMHSEGVPDEYIMQMGGWSTDNVMKRVYRYAFEEDAKKAKAAVDKFYG